MDAELRAQGREEQDPSEAGAALRKRLREGELSEAVVELCAFLGHEPARVALGRPVSSGDAPYRAWAHGFREAETLALIDAIGASALQAFERFMPSPGGGADWETVEGRNQAALVELCAWTRTPKAPVPSSLNVLELAGLSAAFRELLACAEALRDPDLRGERSADLLDAVFRLPRTDRFAALFVPRILGQPYLPEGGVAGSGSLG